MFKKNIFRELKESDNEIFTNLNKKDLEYLLFLINLYKLRLREKINVDFDETFGLEIECEDARDVLYLTLGRSLKENTGGGDKPRN